MTPIDAVVTALNTIQSVTGKVYHMKALKNASAPFVFWFQDSESERQSLDGYTGLKEDGYEIHIVTKNLNDLNGISSAARAAIIALQGTTTNGFLYESIDISQTSPVLNEREVGMYRKVYSLTIDYQETQTPENNENNGG